MKSLVPLIWMMPLLPALIIPRNFVRQRRVDRTMDKNAFDENIYTDRSVEEKIAARIARDTIQRMRILFLVNTFNSLTQRAYLELTEVYKMDIQVEYAIDEEQMVRSVEQHVPDVIICPFLTKKVPDRIWKNKKVPCLIVHPGIQGDRGASSIDWALKDGHTDWGVTILQADKEMDAGDVYVTRNFKVPENSTKSSLYRGPVIDAAMDGIHEALKKIALGVPGLPLDYSNPAVKGRLRPRMKLDDRTVKFELAAEEVVKTIRFSDSYPGAPAVVGNCSVFLYDAHVDSRPIIDTNIPPGTVTAQLNGAVQIACRHGSIWVTHMKGRGKGTKLPRIKLPSADVLPQDFVARIPTLDAPSIYAGPESVPFTELWVDVTDGVATINFPFLNGAMSTRQCERLTDAFRQVCQRPGVKVIVLAGGMTFWSNGINLNTIEASEDPFLESWKNINAIDDFVLAVASVTDKITVAALQGNAGAGGAMAALACDLVWVHGNTVINPHYKTMGLHGSEYWTYFLPKRVGKKRADELTNSCMPISAATALRIGMVDDILTPSKAGFMKKVSQQASLLTSPVAVKIFTSRKIKERSENWLRNLQHARKAELSQMFQDFAGEKYNKCRKAFVYKDYPSKTPEYLKPDAVQEKKSIQAEQTCVAQLI